MTAKPRIIEFAMPDMEDMDEEKKKAMADMMKVAGSAYGGGAIRLGWFEHPLVIDMAGMEMPPEVPLLVDHKNETDCRIGMVVASNANNTLAVAGEIMADANPCAANVAKQARAGMDWQLSMGAEILKLTLIPEGTSLSANGQTVEGPIYHVQKSRLREVSVTPAGADASTRLSIAAALTLTQTGGPNMAADPAKTSPAEPATIQAAAPTTPASPVIDVQAAIKAERQRVAAIKDLCAGQHADIEAAAIADGSTPEQVMPALLKAVRAARPAAPNVYAPGAPVMSRQLVEAALCLATNATPADTLVKEFGEQTVAQADKIRNAGFRQLAQRLCASHGIYLPDTVGSEWIKAAFSLDDLGGIVGAVANKALQRRFTVAEACCPLCCSVVSHNNFQLHTVYSMGLTGDLEQVGPTGELKHLKAVNESRTRQVQTRGAVLTLSREAIINDEMGALIDMAARIGDKALQAREKVLFTLINATANGSSHWTSARNNYMEGAGTALGTANGAALGSALAKYKMITGPDGDPVMVSPQILLVPPALEITAKQLMASQYYTAGSGATPTANIWQNAYKVMVSRWLGASSGLTGASDTAWYLLPDPGTASVPALEVAYLNGQQQPIVETFGLSQDVATLGYSWRIYWDFNCNLAEWRVSFKSRGNA